MSPAPWRQFLLPRPLWFLLRQHWKARLRQSRRSLRSIRGKVYGIAMAIMFCLWLVPSVVMAFVSPRVPPETTRLFFAPALFGFCLLTLLTSGTESGVHFLPAEVDQLFPGPFRRRELLLYRVIHLTAGVVLVGLLFSAILLRCVTYWIAGYAGLVLGLVFLNLLQIALGILISLLAEASFTRFRRVVLLGLLGLLVWGAVLAVQSTGWEGGVSTLSALRQSLPAKIVLAPFEVVAQVATSTRLFPDFLGWTAVAVAMNVGMLWLILSLDANYMEQSIVASQRLHDRMTRARRGQGLAATVKARGRLRPPRLPHLAGAGPIAWRQLTMALRNSHVAILLVLFIIAAVMFPAFFLDKRRGVAFAAPAISMMIFLLPQLLQYDFRGDLERLDVLKSLPLSPWGVVLGQLATPVLLSSLLFGAVLTGMGLGGMVPVHYLLRGALLVIPANLFLYSIENLMFLLFPFQTHAGGTGDIQAVGRNMLTAFGKIGAMVLGFGIAAGVGGLTWWLTGKAELAFLLGVFCSLLLLSGLLIPLMVLAYHRLDPATHQHSG